MTVLTYNVIHVMLFVRHVSMENHVKLVLPTELNHLQHVLAQVINMIQALLMELALLVPPNVLLVSLVPSTV